MKKIVHVIDPVKISPTYTPKVCLHVVRRALTDVRAMRAVKALQEAGCSVTVVDIETTTAQAIGQDMGGIQLKHILMPTWQKVGGSELFFFLKSFQIFLLSVIKLIQVDADIYHACEVTALPASFIAARIHRKPLIFEAYELPLEDVSVSEMGLLRRLFHALTGVLLRILIPTCAAVITVSPPIVRRIRQRYHISKVALVRNILPYQRVERSNRLRHYLELPLGVRIALYQGNLQPDRGLDVLVCAAEFLEKDNIIVIMGKNIGATQTHLEALIRRKGVADRVKIIPAVPYDELLDWTSSADLGLTLIPLDYTLNMKMALPNKFFEYLMAGLPVLSSPLESVSELINRYDVGQVTASLEPAEVGIAINKLFNNPTELARLRVNALIAARQLCWEEESKELLRLYQELLAAHHA